MNNESRLWHFFQNTNEWLRYAEQKNSHFLMMIYIQIVIVSIIVGRDPNSLKSHLLLFGIFFIAVSFLIIVFSFFPFKKYGELVYFKNNAFLRCLLSGRRCGYPKDDDLILYHRDMTKYSRKLFKEKLNKYIPGSGHKTKNNIISNSCRISF
jgi:hypothetical protein